MVKIGGGVKSASGVVVADRTKDTCGAMATDIAAALAITRALPVNTQCLCLMSDARFDLT